MRYFIFLLGLYVLAVSCAVVAMSKIGSVPAEAAQESGEDSVLQKTEKFLVDGLPKDALDLVRPYVLNNESKDGKALDRAVRIVNDCLNRLNRPAEVDEFLEEAVKIHSVNWRVLLEVGNIYFHSQHQGSLIDGEFQRGVFTGKIVGTADRDRVRAMQLYSQAAPLALKDKDTKAVSDFFLSLANTLNTQNWRLQALTDITTLPDYSDDRTSGYGTYGKRGGIHYGGRYDGGVRAPVDEQGNPVLYRLPKSFEEAKSDGERWRWCLEQAANVYPACLPLTLRFRADFSLGQFGEHTLQEFAFFRDGRPTDEAETDAGVYSLENLPDGEVIAKLATGIKKFKLDEEFHYIALYKQIVQKSNNLDDKTQALQQLASIAQNRRQFVKAAGYLHELIELTKGDTQQFFKNQLQQIVGNWGRFEASQSQVAGMNAKLRYTFRNGKKVHLTAHKINVDKLISGIKEYLNSKPLQFEYNRLQIDNIGYNLVFGINYDSNAPVLRPNAESPANIQKKYLGEKVADWAVELKPAAKHFDRQKEIPVSIDKAGAYLVKAVMENGNTEYIVLWLNDLALVQKSLNGEVLYFAADAKTGQAVEDTKLDFFGYRLDWRSEGRTMGRQRQVNVPIWTFKEFTDKTDKDGLATVVQSEEKSRFQWLLTAKDKQGRFAHLGFHSVWFSPYHAQQFKQQRVFFLSDRPVYRPGDKVELKCWFGTAEYDAPNTSEWANRNVHYQIFNPQGEKIEEKSLQLDAYGGLTATLELPKNAKLGQYGFSAISHNAPNHPIAGSGSFRVEEYRKPEYEVSVEAPKDPVALGEKVKALIKAKYYFGSPVTEATVKYKVMREKADDAWYPIRPWDWFYGCGYSWFAYDAPWLDGWGKWGCCRPAPFWFPRPSFPPEIVSEQEVKIGADGTVEVEIDSAIAKEMFPNDNQRYTVTAEVVDNSRRTIVGSGSVLLSKEPFKVNAWTNRGYYEPNDKIEASFQARRLDGKPVSGNGEVIVSKISYERDSLKPVYTEQHKASVQFNEEGKALLSLCAAEGGQYKISCKLKEQEGGYVYNVYAPEKKAENASWKFNAVELIPNKAEYQPDEKVELLVNTNQKDSTVLVFIKPQNGIAKGKPQVLRFDGQSQKITIKVQLGDMPNMFFEDLTVSEVRVTTETKEIVVPPAPRIVNVDIKPTAATYKPGEKAKAELTLTDQNGEPVVGQTVVSIYDKSVEYISGGSNVADIKEFFWKWRRHHHPQSQSNLVRFFRNLSEPNKPSMEQLGIFGGLVALDDAEISEKLSEKLPTSNTAFSTGGGGIVPMAPAAAPQTMRRGVAKSTAIAEDQMVVTDKLESVAAKGDDAWANGKKKLSSEKGAGGALVEPTVRKNFADTALWVGALETGKDGKAAVELTMPESLTTWKVNVWSMSGGTRVGYGSTEVITRKNLMVRMQTPRFLVEKDKAVFSAIVHNFLSKEKEVNVELEVAGGELRIVNGENSNQKLVARCSQLATIPANGEARIDWEVEAKLAGDATVLVKALTDEESDAMQKTMPVYVHGILKQEAKSGYIAPEQPSQTFEFTVPAERKPEQTKLTVRFSPTLAASMIEALPYLVDYPYGCTEQTLNRFLPTVITQKVLLDSGVEIEQLKDRKTNLNAQELGDKRKPAIARKVAPVFDTNEVKLMVSDGVEKLTNMQCSDGGWGWFSGYGERSSAHLTALVVHGLRIAKANDAAVDDAVIQRGITWLQNYQAHQVELLQIGELPEEQRKNKHYKTRADEMDAFVAMVLGEAFAELLKDGDVKEMPNPMLDKYLKRDVGKLSLYGVSMYGIAATLYRRLDVPQQCVKIIEQYLVQDDENQTAYLNLGNYNGWCWWSWHGSEFETQAYYLKLLMRTNPKSPVAPRLVKYLLNNRRHATYWNSTRDTAIVVEAFAEFLKATGESKPDVTVEVLYDGRVKKTVKITPQNLFEIDNTLILQGGEVSTGKHKIELQKKGDAPLYFNAYMENFTLEDHITKAGLEVKIERRFYKLERDKDATAQHAGGRGQVSDLKVEKYKRVPLTEEQIPLLTSGDLVEVELITESKNDYESILIEDRKAAGLEPVEQQSGYNGNEMGAYVEFRDERVSMFVYQLSRGKHSISYRLRAETPGKYSALPAKVEAMYAPELKGNSDENKIRVEDKK